MMLETLKERMVDYEASSDLKLTKKLPVVITINGRCFRKTTSLFQKPYAEDFVTIMGQVLIQLASEIEGSLLVYSFNDEINVICRNDQTLESEAWYDNHVQKIASASAAIASTAFLTAANKQNIKLIGSPIFIAKTFVLPSVTETINYLISKQHQASQTAIYMACFYELLKKYDVDKVLKILKNLSIEEKYDLLLKEFNIDLHDYPLAFWRGMACYRVKKLVDDKYKLKLTINDKLPFFSKDQIFLQDIIKYGT